ncbi:ETS-related transcription factor Elf-5-like [Portunus trituberculatus]|uniref:ETS-related transcription factor Elf-5-like n=1 Tax=Portunus trituberculatus TaxID=210409 RepID=UPI001E1D0E13|nr:ETS-related transcription factor Elf-5-like [Portunus trituberculatus]
MPNMWEFLMRLLCLPSSLRASIIQWESMENFTFRLVSPEGVARLWSFRKRQDKSKRYNNFARGLRYHYKTTALRQVPDRQLVYQCGEKAIRYLRTLNRM